MAYVRDRERKDGTRYHSVYWRENGRQHCLSWNDPAEAERCRDLIDRVGSAKAREIMRIVAEPHRAQTVAQFLTAHIDGLTGVEKGTTARYRAYVKNDLGALGDIPLTALARADVADWITALRTGGASGKTISNKHGFLAGAFNAAVRDGVLKANPCDGNKLPRWDRAEMTFLTRDEFRIVKNNMSEHYKPLVEFLVASGARWSEATALKPSDIDQTGGTVRISRAWKVAGTSGYEIGVPKTRKSVRTINVPTDLLKRLDYSQEWLFTTSAKTPVRIHSFQSNIWKPSLAKAAKAGLTKTPRVHDLRHTCASWLIQAGRPLPAIQAHLGHESIVTTIGTYGHLDRSSGKDNADAIANMLD